MKAAVDVLLFVVAPVVFAGWLMVKEFRGR